MIYPNLLDQIMIHVLPYKKLTESLLAHARLGSPCQLAGGHLQGQERAIKNDVL